MDCFDAQIQCEEFYGEYTSCDTGDCGECEYCADLELEASRQVEGDDEYAYNDVEDFHDEDYDGEAETPYGNDYEIPFDDFMDGEFW